MKIIKILALGIGVVSLPFVLLCVWEYYKKSTIYIRTS